MKEDSSKRANGHLEVPDYASIDVPPEPLNDVVSPVQGGSVLEMQTGLFALGRNRALQSGTAESRSEDAVAPTDHARAMAKETYRDKFDPSQNAHDAMHQAEYDRVFAQRAEAEQAEQHAAANLREAEINLGRAPKAGPKPQAHPLLVAAFTAVITVTVAPTLHDLLATSDDMLAWFLATLGSALVGFMVTWAILSGRRSKWEWVGVIAGVTLGVGLCAVRLSATGDAGDKGIAVGLTIVEIATVLLIEWQASGLRTRDAEWLPKHAAEIQAFATRDAALADHSRWKNKVKELNEAIATKIAIVENRHNRNINLPELEAVAIKAVMDGYNAGITENIGRLRGVRLLTRRSA
jgi:hypothetical protein